MVLDSRFHHVGFATKNIDLSLGTLLGLGFYPINSEKIEDKQLGVKVLFVRHATSNLLVEVIEPLQNELNPLKSILKQRSGLYHIAMEVVRPWEYMRINGLKPILPRCTPAVAFDGRHVIFSLAKDGSIIEFISLRQCDCKGV